MAFKLMMGTMPVAIPLTFENTRYPAIEEQIANLNKNREEALATHELARNRMVDRRKNKFTPFKKGDLVWLDTQNLKTNYHKKMAPKQEGPFKIMDILGPLMYKLKLPESWRIHNVFHTVLLTPYVETKVHGPNFTRPPPDIENDEECYEVETILRHQKRGRGYWYFVKWKGYPITEASWEPSPSFKQGGEKVLKEYQNSP
jgi:hypothetical protein